MGAHAPKSRVRAHRVRVLMIGLMALGSLAVAAPVAAAAPTPTVQFRLPFTGGQTWRISQNWNTGSHLDALNKYAYDIQPPSTHLPVLAAASGTVQDAIVPTGAKCSTDSADKDLAIIVRIKHTDNTYSDYVHLTTALVHKGDKVQQGQIIGTSGCTGHTDNGSGGTFEHLHFSRDWFDSTGHYVSMPFSFQDVPASTDSSTGAPKELPSTSKGNFTYTSLNPCSQDTTQPLGDPQAVPVGQFCARFYRDKNLDKPLNDTTGIKADYWSGMSILSPNSFFDESSLPFQQATPYGVKPYATFFTAATFSARYLIRYNFTAATWTFHLTTSDGIKVYIDNMTTPVYSSWVDRSSVFSNDFVRSMTAGYHLIKVEYYDDGNGPSQFSFDFDNCTSIC